MPTRHASKLAAISAVQLICAAPAAGQPRVNQQAEAMARFSARLTAEYRFMVRDLILRDTSANLIVDVLPGAVPMAGR